MKMPVCIKEYVLSRIGCHLAQILRRHGDEFERTAGGYYRAHGRVDDTMNLGGIKVTSESLKDLLLPLN